MKVITFHPRFVREQDLATLSNLWHLSATACALEPVNRKRHARLLWTAAAFYADATHMVSSSTAVYKDLVDMLEFGGR